MWKTLLLALSIVSAAGFELTALAALAGAGPWLHPSARGFAWSHGLALAAIMAAAALHYPASYRRKPAALSLFILGLCGPLPGVGFAFLLGWGLLVSHPPRREYEEPLVIGLQEHLTLERTRRHPLPPGSTILEVLNGIDPAERRAAILMLRSVLPGEALPLLKKAVQDSDEQVRLLAQNELERLVGGLERRARDLESIQGRDSAAPVVALAELCFHLFSLQRSDDSGRMHLERAIALCQSALEIEPDREAARLLLMRCCFEAGEPERAAKLLEALRRGGCDPRLLAQWEAELAFTQRDGRALAEMLSRMRQAPVWTPDLAAVIEFWKPSAADPS